MLLGSGVRIACSAPPKPQKYDNSNTVWFFVSNAQEVAKTENPHICRGKSVVINHPRSSNILYMSSTNSRPIIDTTKSSATFLTESSPKYFFDRKGIKTQSAAIEII